MIFLVNCKLIYIYICHVYIGVFDDHTTINAKNTENRKI